MFVELWMIPFIIIISNLLGKIGENIYKKYFKKKPNTSQVNPQKIVMIDMAHAKFINSVKRHDNLFRNGSWSATTTLKENEEAKEQYQRDVAEIDKYFENQT